MSQRRTIALVVFVGALAVSWIFLAPIVGLPFGANVSTGPSMGDSSMVVNVWIDAEPAVDDVVIYHAGETGLTNDRIVHRVVGETDAGLVTQGDANSYTDQEVRDVPYVGEEHMVGVVVARIPVPWLAGAWVVVTGVVIAGDVVRGVKKSVRS